MRYLQILVNGLVTGSIYGLAALGFNLIYGTTKIFHVAYGSLIMIALYFVTSVSLNGTSVYWAVAVGLASSFALGGLVYIVLYAPLERLGRNRTMIFIAALGLATLIEALIPWFYGPQPLTFNLPSLNTVVFIGKIAISPLDIAAIVAALVLSLTLWAVIKWSTYGRQLRAITSNVDLGSVMGIRRGVIIGSVFAVGTAIGFIGLTMQSMSSSVTPVVDVTYTLIAAMIVLGGGAGSLVGSYVIALAWGILQNGITLWVSADWANVIVYLAFLVLILIRPFGLMSSTSRRML
jgi:branched-chain amino acid transport system permease protein